MPFMVSFLKRGLFFKQKPKESKKRLTRNETNRDAELDVVTRLPELLKCVI